MTKLGIFIFRRDCRLDDNLGLNLLAQQVDQILPLFILDSNQIVQTNKNSQKAVQQLMSKHTTDALSKTKVSPSTLTLIVVNFEGKEYYAYPIKGKGGFEMYLYHKDDASLSVPIGEMTIEPITNEVDTVKIY